MIERGRFAPTPSGLLHVGSARTAIASALAAWSVGGRWVLRVEDLDGARVSGDATRAMLDDLRWLGLTWDEGPDVAGPHAPYAQSERTALYREALWLLRSKGLVYACACSRREVEEAARAPHGAEAVYAGTCRDRDPEAVHAQARALGREVAWRFRCDHRAPAVVIDDRVAGRYEQHVAREVGDFVVARGNAAAYQLAVVVDDIAMEITEVLRGDDLLASTPRQVLLYRALGASPPRWVHIPLVLGDDGQRLAKRHGAMGIATLRARGHDPVRLRRSLLATLGVHDDGTRDLRIVARRFRTDEVPRCAPRWVLADESLLSG